MRFPTFVVGLVIKVKRQPPYKSNQTVREESCGDRAIKTS